MKAQGEVTRPRRERKGRPLLLVVITFILVRGLNANKLGLFDLLRVGHSKIESSGFWWEIGEFFLLG